jgi:hypothetical protein
MSSSVSGKPSPAASVEDAYTAPAVTQLRKNAPEIYEQFIKAKQEQWRHERHLAWADLLAQIIGHLSGLAALVVLAAISWHSIDRGDATQGASIICTGAVSIVAVFVTGRLATGGGRDRGKSAAPDRDQH